MCRPWRCAMVGDLANSDTRRGPTADDTRRGPVRGGGRRLGCECGWFGVESGAGAPGRAGLRGRLEPAGAARRVRRPGVRRAGRRRRGRPRRHRGPGPGREPPGCRRSSAGSPTHAEPRGVGRRADPAVPGPRARTWSSRPASSSWSARRSWPRSAGATSTPTTRCCPRFPGIHGPRDALAYGVKIAGATLFLVDAGVDTGPIIAQVAVPVLDDDTEETLTERIKDAERRQLVDIRRPAWSATAGRSPEERSPMP